MTGSGGRTPADRAPVAGRRRRWRRAPALVLVAAALAVAPSCSEEATTLDASATESAVAKVVASRVEPEVTATRCPDDLELEEGGTFACTLTLAATVGPKAAKADTEPDEATGTLRVEVTQVDGDGRLDVVLLDAVVTTEAVADDLRAQLKARFERSFQVSCGEIAHRVVEPEGTFTCRARDKGGPRTVEVTVADVAGTLRYDVLS